jgi:hypothetical protein
MAWAKVERHVAWTGPGRTMGLTNLDAGITYVRGWDLVHPFDNTEKMRPSHIIAHELAHIMLDTRDEATADRQAVVWLARNVATQEAR